MKSLCCSVALLLSFACSSSEHGVPGAGPGQKSEAAALFASGQAETDWCDRNGWYADGECDSFCPEADADCGTSDGDVGIVCALFLEASDGRCGRTADDPCRTQDPDCGGGVSGSPPSSNYDCDVSEVACELGVICPSGQVPTRLGNCYGPCVPEAQCAASTECPGSCGVPGVCQVCDDGSCATPSVACNADGSCGDVSYSCAGEPMEIPPAGPSCDDGSGTTSSNCPPADQCPASCDVPALCRLCDDGSCGTPQVACNADGSCGAVTYECGTATYAPCGGKEEGDACSVCQPNTDCFETAVLKECQAGQCVTAQP